MYYVYKHENKINGKVYIGITSMNVRRRWENGNGYSKQVLFWRAIQKYGWDAFSHEILYEELTQEEAEHKEIELISAYSSNNPKYGYNVQNGGSVGKHSEETKRKISEAHKGKSVSLECRAKISETLKGRALPEETRKKISETLRGDKCYWYGKVGPTKGRKAPLEELKRRSESQKGKTLSEETKQKISEALKGEKHPWYGKKLPDATVEKMKQNAKNKKKVKCVETGMVYNSIHDAGRENKINYKNIHSVCAGQRKIAGGYHWEYVR